MAYMSKLSNTMAWDDANRIHHQLLAGLQEGWGLSFLQDGQLAEMQTLPHGDAKETFPVPATDEDKSALNWQLRLSPPTDSNGDEILVTCRDNVPRVIMGITTWKTYCFDEAVRRTLELIAPAS